MNAIVNSEPGKILIIDEHPHSRMAVEDLLCLDGYEVIEADESLNIIDNVIKKRPDLILLDVMMPQMEGFEVCQSLKQDGRTSAIPIIFMTVAEDNQLRRRCTQVGGDDVLTKPIERLKLSSRVKSLIEQKRLYEGLDQIEQVLFAIARAIENRYPNNGNSCVRLATLANSFGKFIELPFAALQNLRYAAYLHDIGTVSIPDEIMLKKGELTLEERGIIQQHVLIGEEICQPLPNSRGVLPIIRHHHERWDGTGYPDGLVASEIPWLAQIFQILDIYVALTSERPHKKTFSPQEAITIISEEADKGWRNPQLVKQFTNFIYNRELSTPKNKDIKFMVKAIWNGTVLAESDNCEVVEGNYYFPPDAIKKEYFSNSETHTTCPWKGVASYYTIVVDGQTNKDAAWYYPQTKEKAKNIEGYIAFWRGVKVEA